MTDDKSHADTFDEVAELYDRVRSGYPEELFDDLFEMAGQAPTTSRVLEVGCGTGKATLPLLARGAEVLALDPGANLLAVARRNAGENPRASFVQARFEDFRLPRQDERDLVVSAQAFHWIDPDLRFELAANALRAGGAIALMWNVPIPGESETHHAIREAYRTHAPELFDVWWSKIETGPKVEDTIDDSGRFGTVHMCRYRRNSRISARDYGPLLETQSDHRMLADGERTRLLAAVTRAIESTGGWLEGEVVTRLYVAKKP